MSFGIGLGQEPSHSRPPMWCVLAHLCLNRGLRFSGHSRNPSAHSMWISQGRLTCDSTCFTDLAKCTGLLVSGTMSGNAIGIRNENMRMFRSLHLPHQKGVSILRKIQESHHCTQPLAADHGFVELVPFCRLWPQSQRLELCASEGRHICADARAIECIVVEVPVEALNAFAGDADDLRGAVQGRRSHGSKKLRHNSVF